MRLGGCRCFPVSSARGDESSDGGLPRKAGVGKGGPCPDCLPSRGRPSSRPESAWLSRRAPALRPLPMLEGPRGQLSRPIIRVLRRRERGKIDGRGGEGASGVPAPHLLRRVFSRLRSGPVGLPGTLQGPAGLFKAEAAEGGGEGEGGKAPRSPPPLVPRARGRSNAALCRPLHRRLSSPDGPPKGYDLALQQPLAGGVTGLAQPFSSAGIAAAALPGGRWPGTQGRCAPLRRNRRPLARSRFGCSEFCR